MAEDNTPHRRGFSVLKPEDRAAALLNESLNSTEIESLTNPQLMTDGGDERAVEEEVDIRRAMKDAPVLEVYTDRHTLRLLIFTRDETITSEGSLAQKRVLELSELFAEIHVVVLSLRRHGVKSNSRLSHNIWLYPTNSKSWWRVGFDAHRTAKEQLIFGKSFRADIILAEDPFEAGVVACIMGNTYERPVQIHIFEDFYDPDFRYAEAHNDIRLFMAHYSLKRADCVRTKSEYIRDRVVQKNRSVKNRIEVLPLYYDLKAWEEAVPVFNPKEKYPQCKFLLLTVSRMTSKSHTDQVITGAAKTLIQYPTIKLVIVGDGPNRKLLERQVVTLGLSNQIFFEPATSDVLSYLKAADLFLYLSEDPEEEFVVLQAAAAGIPMIAGFDGLPGELFLDGESAFICHNDNSPCISQKIGRILNENHLRFQFSQNARETVYQSVEQDYSTYLKAYQSSIERCVATDS